MKKSWIVLGAILGVVLIVGLSLAGVYNSLVARSQAIDGQWAQVETQYQRRFDLIPNLVESVKGIMIQEQTVFLALAEARTRYAGRLRPRNRPMPPMKWKALWQGSWSSWKIILNSAASRR